MMWIKVDPAKPPSTHMVAIYKDGSGAVPLSKFDNSETFMMAEDGWEMSTDEVLNSFDWWAPAPEGFEPHFMSMTGN